VAELDGRVALVTGGSSGIGAETARQLRAQGCAVALNARSADGPGPALAERLGGVFEPADVSDPGQAEALVGAVVARYGRLDVLVNSAGATELIRHDDLAAATPEIWHRLYATNVVAPWVLTTAARPHLAAAPGGGVVVNVGSLSGLKPGGSSIPYAVSKAALHQQTRMLAAALAPGIRVNAVAPSIADTPWTRGMDEARAAAVRDIPLGRLATPADVARVIVTQVLSPYVTGAVWRVDGGSGLTA
jgi:NAD(P)-dependent dehydrogenase (short-subunit alcohol dehydrogenase family)